MVKIYNQPGEEGILLQEVRVNEEKSKELNDIMKRFNDTLERYPEELHQFFFEFFFTSFHCPFIMLNRLKLFNAMLEGLLEDQQQSILMKFDTTKVFKELFDVVSQFYMVAYKI